MIAILRTVSTSNFVDAKVQAVLADALATANMEPSVTARAHGYARRFAFVHVDT